MSTIFNGYADVRAIGPGSTVTVGGYASVFMDSLPVAHRASVNEHVGTDGTTAAIVHTNEYIELALSFKPASSTSIAAAQAKAILLPKGSTVTLSQFNPVNLGGEDILNADWLLVGDVTLNLSATDAGVVDLTIRNYLDKQAGLLVRMPVLP